MPKVTKTHYFWIKILKNFKRRGFPRSCYSGDSGFVPRRSSRAEYSKDHNKASAVTTKLQLIATLHQALIRFTEQWAYNKTNKK